MAEYSEITDVEWGVLDTGLDRPTGIALEGNQLFVSTFGDGKITAYELDSDGKAVQKQTQSKPVPSTLWALKLAPMAIYYVDNARDEVVRIDLMEDEDGDGIGNEIDNCPFIANAPKSIMMVIQKAMPAMRTMITIRCWILTMNAN